MYYRPKPEELPDPMRKFAPDTTGKPQSRFILRLKRMCQFTWPLFLFLLIALIGIALILYYQLRSVPPVTASIPSGGSSSLSIFVLLNESNFIEAYVEASGGQEALSQVTSIRCEGRLHESAKEQTFILTKRRPNLMLLELNGDGPAVAYGYDGSAFWQKRKVDQAQAGFSPVVGDAAGALRGMTHFFDPLLAYALDGEGIIQVIELDEWQGVSAIRVQLRTANSTRRDVYLHPDSLEIMATVERLRGSGGTRTETFSDYRIVNGFRVPFRIENFVDGKSVREMLLNTWRINVGAAPSLFAAPVGL